MNKQQLGNLIFKLDLAMARDEENTGIYDLVNDIYNNIIVNEISNAKYSDKDIKDLFIGLDSQYFNRIAEELKKWN